MDSQLSCGIQLLGSIDCLTGQDGIRRNAQFHPTDIFAMSEEIRAALRKQADVYEIREINPGTEFYDTIFREGVYVA